jgi:uncharacterized protein
MAEGRARWRPLLALALVVLPVAALAGLGVVWIWQAGLVWQASGIAAGLAALGWAALRLTRPRPGQVPARSLPDAAPPPGWGPRETAAYGEAKAWIAERLPEAAPPGDLPAIALDLVDAVAPMVSGGQRERLSFSLPEGLLLVERAASRYRAFLVTHVPYSDRVSVGTMERVWRHRAGLRLAWTGGMTAWRIGRAAVNPVAAIWKEIERAAGGAAADLLAGTAERELQVVLLQEVAQAAIDLYSGRLRLSEAELAAHPGQTMAPDTSRRAVPPEPPRILVVGQVSAGKSTLVNALLGRQAAAADAAPTTAGLVTHEIVLDGQPCRLIDTAGIGAGPDAALVGEMASADLILWVLRADRPGRGGDRRLLDAFDALFAADPSRIRPPVVTAMTAPDRLPGTAWPKVSAAGADALPAGHPVRAALTAVRGDLPGLDPVPVRAEAPPWNLPALRARLVRALPAAINAQLARRQAEAAALRPGTGDARRVLAGLGALIRRGRDRLRG